MAPFDQICLRDVLFSASTTAPDGPPSSTILLPKNDALCQLSRQRKMRKSCAGESCAGESCASLRERERERELRFAALRWERAPLRCERERERAALRCAGERGGEPRFDALEWERAAREREWERAARERVGESCERESGRELRFAAREWEKAALRRARFTLLLCSLATRLNAPRKAVRRTR